MAAIHRRSQRAPISRLFTLATADDLNGVADATQSYDITGADRVLILQVNDGTAGTAGIDVVEISHDGGENWEAATDVLAIDSDDKTGTVLASGALNAAGVEPTLYAAFKAGPYAGPVALRVSRGAQGTGTAWVTGAPSVLGFIVGGNTGGQLSALA
jgi:hypothetical protein